MPYFAKISLKLACGKKNNNNNNNKKTTNKRTAFVKTKAIHVL